MDSLAKADIFFFITSCAIAIFAIAGIIAAVYLTKILNDIKAITSTARREVENIIDDVGELREDLKEEGKGLISKLFILGDFIRKRVTPPKRKKHHDK